MYRIPDVLIVVDVRREDIAIAEANKVGIPIVGIVDTDGNPDIVSLPIPSNDDALKAVKFLTSKIADAIFEGKNAYKSTVAV
jgi:small subunit ribosomal protein S2